MEERITQCLDIINENILFFNEDSIKTTLKTDLSKDMHNRFTKHYKKFLTKTIADIKTEVEDYHKSNDLYNKYQKLDNLIHSAPELETPSCQFFDDTDVSISSLTINYKREYLESLMKNEKNYDIAIDSLEKKISANKSVIMNYVKKVTENA